MEGVTEDRTGSEGSEMAQERERMILVLIQGGHGFKREGDNFFFWRRGREISERERERESEKVW